MEAITLEGLEAWASEQEPGAAVGQACRPSCCPVARYAGMLGYRGAWVTCAAIQGEFTPVMIASTPLGEVVALVDETHEYRGQPVSREELLGLIADVRAGRRAGLPWRGRLEVTA